MSNEPVAWLYERPSGAAKLSFVQEKMLWEDTTETPLYTHPAKTDKYITDLINLVDAQGQDGTWNLNQYMLGLFNGLEFALSIFESREPKFRELPAKTLTDEEIGQIWKDCMESPYMQVSNPVGFARAILKKG